MTSDKSVVEDIRWLCFCQGVLPCCKTLHKSCTLHSPSNWDWDTIFIISDFVVRLMNHYIRTWLSV